MEWIKVRANYGGYSTSVRSAWMDDGARDAAEKITECTWTGNNNSENTLKCYAGMPTIYFKSFSLNLSVCPSIQTRLITRSCKLPLPVLLWPSLPVDPHTRDMTGQGMLSWVSGPFIKISAALTSRVPGRVYSPAEGSCSKTAFSSCWAPPGSLRPPTGCICRISSTRQQRRRPTASDHTGTRLSSAGGSDGGHGRWGEVSRGSGRDGISRHAVGLKAGSQSRISALIYFFPARIYLLAISIKVFAFVHPFSAPRGGNLFLFWLINL